MQIISHNVLAAMFQQIFNDGIWIKNWPGLNGLKRNDFVRLRIAEFWIDCKSTLPLIYPFVSMKYTKTGTNGRDRSHTTKYRFCPMDAKDFWREHWNVCFDDMWTRLARMLLMELLAVGRVFIVLRLKKQNKNTHNLVCLNSWTNQSCIWMVCMWVWLRSKQK